MFDIRIVENTPDTLEHRNIKKFSFWPLNLIDLIYVALACVAIVAFVYYYFGPVGRAMAALRGDLVYCPEKVIDLGNRKHLEGIRVVIHLENMTKEPVRVEGMNSIGQSMLTGDYLPIEIGSGNIVEIPYNVFVRSINKNPAFQRRIVVYVGSKHYGRQEVSLVVKGNVIDAHQAESAGCCECGQ